MFLGDARENPGDLEFSLVLTTRRLLPNKYPEEREAVADRIIVMRDAQRMKFPAIGAVLSGEGLRGARGAELGAKGAFDIYKKRKAYQAARKAPIQHRVSNIVINPNRNVKTAETQTSRESTTPGKERRYCRRGTPQSRSGC